jgi:prepilin-type N-terminal cleavage/methylation domain-containing protein
MNKNRSGFTIVELLIVIMVIAILAAISIVAFNGVQDRARASAAASSSTQAAKKVKVWQVDNEAISPTCGQFYTLVTGASGSSCNFDYNDTNYQYRAGTNGAYCVTTTVGNKSYRVSEATNPQAGGCSGHGQGGVAAITNLAIDPSAVTSTSNFALMGTNYATFTSAIASDNAHHGSTSLKRTITGAGTIAAKTLFPSYRIAAGSHLSWSLWIYSTRAGAINLHAEGNRVSDGSYAGCGGGATSIPANAWTKVEATCTPSTDINFTGAGAYNLSVQSGDNVWFDEYMVTASSTRHPYADGSSTNWMWNGTPNNSTSTGPTL